MELKLYDTLTKQKRPFTPLDAADVRMYVCGPTVYDFAHIGNARPVIVFDVLYRLLRHVYGVGHVKYVRNITDVDDKINDRAARDFPGLPLNDAIRRVTEQTEKQFHADVDALGCLRPDVEPRATDHIAEMRAIIEKLIAGGFAYVAEDHVLFSPQAMNAANSKLPHYGALANRTLDEMIAGARVDVAPYKRDSTDFVLWKPSKPGEPGWPSPADITAIGRPGWHIECSAMAWKHLGETFDIHGGGIDLVFPHHENEIAQTCCAFHRERMAEVWMHNGFLQVEGEKMSKSTGNFVTIRELLETDKFGGRKWPGEVLRLAMLKTHYRSPIDWTAQSLVEASQNLNEWKRLVANVPIDEVGVQPSNTMMDTLEDDLNTADAISYLRHLAAVSVREEHSRKELYANLVFLGLLPDNLEFAKKADQEIRAHTNRPLDVDLSAQSPFRTQVEERLKQLFVTLPSSANTTSTITSAGILLGVRSWAADILSPGIKYNQGYLSQSDRQFIDNEIGILKLNGLIEERLAARARKDFKESDRIRDELAAMGVVLKDGKDADGKPVTTWEIAR